MNESHQNVPPGGPDDQSSTPDEQPPAPRQTAEAEGQAAPPPAETSEIDLDANVVTGVTLAAGAAVAVLLWFLIGGWSLLVDVLIAGIAGVVLYGVGLVERDRPRTGSVPGTQPEGDATAVAPRAGGVAPSPQSRAIAGALVPLLIGGACFAVASGHHSSTDDVCGAWSDYLAQEQTSMASTDVFDNDYFDAVHDLGSTAADFGDDSSGVVSAGKRLQSLADGSGDTVVTINMGDVDATAGPIAAMCQ